MVSCCVCDCTTTHKKNPGNYSFHRWWTAVNIIMIFVLFLSPRHIKSQSSSSKTYYMSTEHINITYRNPEYFAFFNAKTARPGRWDPKYYVHYHFRSLKPLDNNISSDVWFYEFRSNEYRRGFVEMHFKFCDLVLKDFFFGPALRANGVVCPLPPGEYRLENMSIPELPLLRTFPFRKGRIFGEAAHSGVRIGAAYVDIEIKAKPTRLKKKNPKKHLAE